MFVCMCVQSQFVHGSVMSLESVVTAASLCIRSGDVEARGNREQSDGESRLYVLKLLPHCSLVEMKEEMPCWISTF